jgi:SAM-dependent methyltransferase
MSSGHGSWQHFSDSAARYAADIPDYELHPDPYSRTRILLDWVGKDKRVLELGCSTGYMSKYMSQKNRCSVFAIEMDPLAAQQARPFCEEVLVRDLNQPNTLAGVPAGAFGAVLMGDLLEHLVDPRGLLIQLREVLAPDSKIVICLPNVLHWINRMKMFFGHFDYEDAGTLDHTHLRFFTVESARDLIASAGYRITKFYPAFGGRFAGHARPVWQLLANWFPGLFAFQLLFEALPVSPPAPRE